MSTACVAVRTQVVGMDWRQRIVELVLVKQRLHEVDTQGLWEWRLPSVAATEEQLLAAEARLNEAIDSEYRVFLTYASGWAAFFQAVDLLGADDLGQGHSGKGRSRC